MIEVYGIDEALPKSAIAGELALAVRVDHGSRLVALVHVGGEYQRCAARIDDNPMLHDLCAVRDEGDDDGAADLIPPQLCQSALNLGSGSLLVTWAP